MPFRDYILIPIYRNKDFTKVLNFILTKSLLILYFQNNKKSLAFKESNFLD